MMPTSVTRAYALDATLAEQVQTKSTTKWVARISIVESVKSGRHSRIRQSIHREPGEKFIITAHLPSSLWDEILSNYLCVTVNNIGATFKCTFF